MLPPMFIEKVLERLTKIRDDPRLSENIYNKADYILIMFESMLQDPRIYAIHVHDIESGLMILAQYLRNTPKTREVGELAVDLLLEFMAERIKILCAMFDRPIA